MFCVLLLAAIFTLGGADIWGGQQQPNYHPENFGYNRGPWSSHQNQPSTNPPNDGYSSHYEEGRRTNTCSDSTVKDSPGRFIKSPTETKFYGPYISNIKYLHVMPQNSAPLHGRVKVWLGGVGHHMAIVHFKTDRPNTSFNYKVTLCW